MRLMSVAYTEPAVVQQIKTATRRKGWWLNKNGQRLLLPGDQLTLCRKVMGRKAGEPLVRIVDVEIIDVRREPLSALLDPIYGPAEVALEGFPGMPPEEFIDRFFIQAQKMHIDDEITRIQWEYLPSALTTPARPTHLAIA